MTKVNMSGEIVDEADAKISVFDHGLLYGDGIFEGIRIYNRCIFKYSEHIDRLYDSARAISLTIPISKQTFQDEIIKTCIENKIDSGYLRVIVTRGIGGLGVSSITCKNPQYIIISKEVDPLHGAKSVEDGVDVITTSIRRASSTAIPVQAKTLNYLNLVMAVAQAQALGKQDALMFNEQGYLTEGVGDNVFIIKNRVICTPPPNSGCLAGITRNSVIEIASKMGYSVVEINMTLYDIYVADEIFLTGTLAEIVPVKSVDGEKIGNGQVGDLTKKIASEFRKYIVNNGVKY